MPRTYFDIDGQLCWADLARAEAYADGTRWTGEAMVGLNSRSQWIDETLYRTAGGRWLLNTDATRCNNGPDSYRYLTDDEARDWLIRTGEHEEAVQRHFGEPEEERGPGRPAIGAQVKIAMNPAVVAAVDAAAESAGLSRSEWVRRAVAAAL